MAYRDQWSHEGGFKGHSANRRHARAVNSASRAAARYALSMAAYSEAVNYSQGLTVTSNWYGRAREGARPTRCGGILIDDVPRLLTEMRWRKSWRRSKRQAAYRACRMMIQFREAALAIGVYSFDRSSAA